MSYLLLIIMAFLAGLIDAIAGGGGVISLPALLLFGLPAHTALGTNKLQSLMGSTSAFLNFWKNKKIAWNIVLIGIPFSLVGSFLGAETTYLFSKKTLAIIILFLIPASLILLINSKKLLKNNLNAKKTNILNIIISCFFIGLYDGFFGPGTGTFLIVCLVIFCNVTLTVASGTAKTFNIASNISAFISFAISGSINYKIALLMGVFNIAGGLTGSQLAINKGSRFINKILYVSVSILFIYLIITLFGFKA